MIWKDAGMQRDVKGNPEALRLETVSSLMQKLKISEEQAQQLIKKVTQVGHL